jgi:hypothetical protein
MLISEAKTIVKGVIRPVGVMALDDGTIYTTDERGRCARYGVTARPIFSAIWAVYLAVSARTHKAGAS